jgi:TRAP-type C4-dicarboxylate transport system permease small subunit
MSTALHVTLLGAPSGSRRAAHAAANVAYDSLPAVLAETVKLS